MYCAACEHEFVWNVWRVCSLYVNSVCTCVRVSVSECTCMLLRRHPVALREPREPFVATKNVTRTERVPETNKSMGIKTFVWHKSVHYAFGLLHYCKMNLILLVFCDKNCVGPVASVYDGSQRIRSARG